MNEDRFDVRFINVLCELEALERYFDCLEKQLPRIEAEHQERTQQAIISLKCDNKNSTDYREVRNKLLELHYFTEQVLPRFFRGPVLVSSWAIFESAIAEIADEIRRRQDQFLKLNDIRGDFLNRTKNYFDHILRFPVLLEAEVWQKLQRIMILRHAIAHANGRIESIKDADVKKISQWIEEGIGVSIELDCIMLSGNYVRESYTLISNTIRGLIGRVQEAYPNPMVDSSMKKG